MTTTAIYLPGHPEHVYPDWPTARAALEAAHGGWAPGMLANCVEVPLTDLAERLEAAGIEHQGRVFRWVNTILQARENGAEVLDLRELDAPTRRALRRVERLSDRRWARWYYTDAVGNAVLLCWQRWE